jgi:hypothetical protein
MQIDELLGHARFLLKTVTIAVRALYNSLLAAELVLTLRALIADLLTISS